MDLDQRLELARLFDFYGPLLTKRQQDCFDLYFHQDYSLAEIAQSSGTTRQAVYDLLRRSGLQLEQFERRLGLAARFRKQEVLLADATEALRSLQAKLAAGPRSPEDEEAAAMLETILQRLRELDSL